MAGSLVFVFFCAPLFLNTGLVGRIAIFIFGALTLYAAFKARGLLIGDEDELNASLRRGSRRDVREAALEGSDDRFGDDELEELVRRAENRNACIPPPEYLDDDVAGRTPV